jgi:hypothetical protein
VNEQKFKLEKQAYPFVVFLIFILIFIKLSHNHIRISTLISGVANTELLLIKPGVYKSDLGSLAFDFGLPRALVEAYVTG